MIKAYIHILLISLVILSCTPEGREVTYQKGREITQKEFQSMLDAGQIDHVEVEKKKVYVFLNKASAEKLQLIEAPQYSFPIANYEAFLNEMESIDREHLVQPAVKH